MNIKYNNLKEVTLMNEFKHENNKNIFQKQDQIRHMYIHTHTYIYIYIYIYIAHM